MAIDYVIHTDRKYVHVKGTGQQRMPGMIAVVNDIVSDPEFLPDYNVIFDLHEGGYTAELNDGNDFVAALKLRMADFRSLFILVVPASLLPLAKIYSVLAATGGFDRMKCTTDLHTALEWCGVRE